VNGDKEVALHDYIQSQMGKPFEYGVHDCALFSAGAIDVIADSSIRDELTGLWNDKKSAIAYEKEHGIEDYLKERFSSIDESHIQTGDVILIDMKGWISTSICIGSKIAFLMDKGIQIQPIGSLPIKGVYRV